MTSIEIEETKQSVLFMCRIAFKSIAIGLVVLYALIFTIVGVKAAHSATLKSEALVSDAVVKTSDMFDDVPQRSNVVIGNAPSPGKTVILNSATLQRIADVYNLKWKAASPADQIVVKRSMVTVPTSAVTDALRASLEKSGVTGEFQVTLNNVDVSMELPGNVEPTIEVSQMNYVPGRDVFTAVVAAPNAQTPVKTLQISGSIDKTVHVPVLKEAMKSGDIIGSSDIDWIAVASKTVGNDTVLDADKLIGNTPARMVVAGSPIKARDIVQPQLVARGDDVLLQFSAGGIELSAKGKAMQNGAEGDVIRVLNLSSNQSLRGEVIGNKTIRIQ